MGLSHGTVRFERIYDARLEQVFADWKDPRATTPWPYEQADFRVGGRDICHCGHDGDLRFRVEVVYLDIVENERIVFAETVSEAGRQLCATLVSVAFRPNGAQTRLEVTCQIAELAPGLVDGYRAGYWRLAE
ncbi:MAG: SRPBCC domain-containing protein [Oceanicaulis sp.]|uniref:SRPBCC domain-containing protein n=1 Tax=Glycocaulis sp. TaxID=1969725 RepID=UPI0025C6FB52|nr:SRPBCC domain-containing protein [Glycocaulis sp.]MCC5980300.1 SRPBCC domain-containing protein [Oceanicaulis sp.]MCH8521680.1 SRPBCC domain-containing protein [Glycocaulis sp.]